MFERLFQWGLRNGARILFAAAVVVLVAGVLRAIAGAFSTRQATVFFGQLFGAAHDAALPFFGGLVVHRLDFWREPPTIEPAAASWLLRNGPRLPLGLALVFFAMAIAGLALWVREIGASSVPPLLFQGTWLGPLWSASLLFAGALVLHSLNGRRR